jgi:hypothetical protein
MAGNSRFVSQSVRSVIVAYWQDLVRITVDDQRLLLVEGGGVDDLGFLYKENADGLDFRAKLIRPPQMPVIIARIRNYS